MWHWQEMAFRVADHFSSSGSSFIFLQENCLSGSAVSMIMEKKKKKLERFAVIKLFEDILITGSTLESNLELKGFWCWRKFCQFTTRIWIYASYLYFSHLHFYLNLTCVFFLLCIRRSCLAVVLLLSCKGGGLICLDVSSILQNVPVTSSGAVATISLFYAYVFKTFFFLRYFVWKT